MIKSLFAQKTNNLELGPSISESHLSFREHIGKDVYLMANGDLSMLFELSGICDESLSEAELYAAFTPLRQFCSKLITGIPSFKDDGSTLIQLTCSQRLASYKGSDEKRNSAGETIVLEEKQLFKSCLSKRRFILAVRWQPKVERPWLKGLYQLLKRVKNELDQSHLEELLRQRDYFFKAIKAKLVEANLAAKALCTEQVVDYLNSVLNCGKPLGISYGDDECGLIGDNLVNKRATGSSLGFDFKDGVIRAFTISELPNFFALGRFRLFLDAIPLKSFDLTLSLSHGSKELGSDHIVKKLFFANAPSYQKRFLDLQSLERDVNTKNPLLKMSLKLIAYSDKEDTVGEILAKSSEILGTQMFLEDQIGPHCIATAIPANCSKADHDIVGRTRSLLLDRALMFSPLYTSPSYDKGKRFWLSRSGLPIKIDPFNVGGNNHMTVLGDSESGKSCLTAQFILEFLWRFKEARIRIVDKRSSYQKLCDLFGGKVIAFNEEHLRKNPYSPFAQSSWDEDDIQNTLVFIENAILQSNPGAKISGLHSEILAEALKMSVNNHELNLAYKEAGNDVAPHFNWVDVKKNLPVAAEAKGAKELALKAVEDIARWTVSFDKTGQYGFIFCAYENESVSDTAPLIVFDLEGISDPRLKVIASQLSFLKIARDLKKIKRRHRKLIVFEELGVLVKGDSPEASALASSFIRNIVKTARKIGAQAVGITNELADFTETEAGRSFWQIAPQKLFLPQSRASSEEIKTKLASELSVADCDIISSLRIKKGHYSEAYFTAKNLDFSASFLIPLSPLMNAIVTTKAQEEHRYDELRSEGLSASAAITKLACDHPYGKGL